VELKTVPEIVRRGRRRGIPLYYQVMRSLKEQILSGKLAQGERLLSEAELVRSFSVSRVVVRRALSILEDEHLIVRMKGRGTFVAEGAGDDVAPRISGYLDDLTNWGPSTSIEVLEFGLRRAPGDLAALFEIDEGDDVFFAKRLRLVDGRPFAVIANYLPRCIGELIPLRDLKGKPMMTLIESQTGVAIDWASQVIEAVSADEELARLLQVDLLSPVLKMTITAYSPRGEVLNLASAYYRSDIYHHHGYLKRNRKEDSWTPMRPKPDRRQARRGNDGGVLAEGPKARSRRRRLPGETDLYLT
jgi:DNA-binding GntR family transcriptional regulator